MSPAIQAYVRARQQADPALATQAALVDLVAEGVGDVAEEAATLLDSLPEKAGAERPEPVALLGGVTWPSEGQPGMAELWVAGDT